MVMAEQKKLDDFEKDELALLTGELDYLLMSSREQIEAACIQGKLDELFAWVENVHGQDDLSEMERYLCDSLRRMKNALELTGRAYLVLGNESPAIAPPDEPDPQAFFKASDRVTEIINTLLQLKTHHDWKEAIHD